MQLQTYAWEGILLSWAHEARQPVEAEDRHRFDPGLLASAYAHCESLTALHSRSFFMASGLLPAEKRRAVRALYAFCRVSDDIVDSTAADRSERLAAWQGRVSSARPPEEDLVAVAWSDARHRHRIPQRYAEQLLDGVAADLLRSRYGTFDELAQYSYGVASTVGLMAMHIIGFEGPEAIPYAVKLGVALQVTNILRDVADDLRAGRVYLPQEELARFGLSEADLAAGRVTERWRRFMRFQIERNRRLYAEAMPGLRRLDAGGRLAIAAASDLYRGILDDIERHDYDVFTRRAHLTTAGKLRRLPGSWWRSRG